MSVGSGSGPLELLDGDGRGERLALGDFGAEEDAGADAAACRWRSAVVGVGVGVGLGDVVVRSPERVARVWVARVRADAAECPGAAAGPVTPS